MNVGYWPNLILQFRNDNSDYLVMDALLIIIVAVIMF